MHFSVRKDQSGGEVPDVSAKGTQSRRVVLIAGGCAAALSLVIFAVLSVSGRPGGSTRGLSSSKTVLAPSKVQQSSSLSKTATKTTVGSLKTTSERLECENDSLVSKFLKTCKARPRVAVSVAVFVGVCALVAVAIALSIVLRPSAAVAASSETKSVASQNTPITAGPNIGVIVGGAFGGIAGVAILVAFAVFGYRHFSGQLVQKQAKQPLQPSLSLSDRTQNMQSQVGQLPQPSSPSGTSSSDDTSYQSSSSSETMQNQFGQPFQSSVSSSPEEQQKEALIKSVLPNYTYICKSDRGNPDARDHIKQVIINNVGTVRDHMQNHKKLTGSEFIELRFVVGGKQVDTAKVGRHAWSPNLYSATPSDNLRSFVAINLARKPARLNIYDNFPPIIFCISVDELTAKWDKLEQFVELYEYFEEIACMIAK